MFTLAGLLVTLHIIDLWQHYVWCLRSGVTRCTFFMMRSLCRMCQCGLHAVRWSHIGIRMLLLTSEPRSTAGLPFLSPYLWGTILLILYSMMCDLQVLRARPMFFYWLKLLAPFLSSTVSSFSSFYGWCCGTEIFGLIGCKSLSPPSI